MSRQDILVQETEVIPAVLSAQSKQGVGFLNRVFLVVLLAYLVAIIFLPRIGGDSAYGANLRYEDLITPLLGISSILLFGRYLHRSAVLFGGLYFSYSFGITLLNISFGKLPFAALLIFGKEFQFYLGFILMLAIAQRYSFMRWVKSVVVAGILFACATGVWMAATGKIGYYGISYITEMNSPSLSALMYFNLIVFALYLRLDTRSVFFRRTMEALSLVMLGLLCVVGSRMGFIMATTFLLMLWILNSRRPIMLILSLITLTAGVIGIYFSAIHYFGNQIASFEFENPVLRGSISRLGTMFVNDTVLANSRFEAWRHFYSLSTETIPGAVFGCGRGCGNLYLGSVYGGFPLGLSGDSQYMVMFLESGLLGIGLFSAAIISLGRSVRKEFRGIYLSYLAAYLIGGIFAEVFLLSKGGGLFWVFSAIVIGKEGFVRSPGTS